MKKFMKKKTRKMFMRILLNIATKNKSDEIKPHAPELYKLRKRKDFDREIKVLVGLGLISVIRGPVADTIRYKITPEGMCYFEKLADERRQLFVKSVLIPIIVSILTAIITMYALPPLGKQAETWFQSNQPDTQSHSVTPAPSDIPAENHISDPECIESTPITPPETP